MTFHDLLMQNYIASWDKQITFSNWFKERGNPDWDFDMKTGKLAFGKAITFYPQLLGTEGTSSKTWLWSWANTMSKIPSKLIQSSTKLRDYGQKHNIPEFTKASLPLDQEYHGHHFSMVASAVLDANIYYRGPYENGAMFLLVKTPIFPVKIVNTPEHIVSTITQFAATVQTDNLRLLVTHYLETCGLKLTPIDDVLTGTFADGSRVDVIFVGDNRLQEVKAHIKPRI
ncbi:MAG: hypothetical protein H0X30_08145 [Anaerolineae bacterium]|nr:hypothetical protein [Anaerolineae bacterium]